MTKIALLENNREIKEFDLTVTISIKDDMYYVVGEIKLYTTDRGMDKDLSAKYAEKLAREMVKRFNDFTKPPLNRHFLSKNKDTIQNQNKKKDYTMKIYNTFGFTPNLKMEGVELVPAEHRGRVELDEKGVVKVGHDIISQISDNKDKIFLVNKVVFEKVNYFNMAKWDDNNKEPDNSAYYGLIFKKDI